MKVFAALVIVALSLPLSVRADEVVSGPVIGGGATPSASATENCVEVEIGGEKTSRIDCINAAMKRQADHVQPVRNVPPIDESSPAIKSHGFNETALQEQYGKNLGKSAVPYRPAK